VRKSDALAAHDSLAIVRSQKASSALVATAGHAATLPRAQQSQVTTA
jgi:hypothetical protein